MLNSLWEHFWSTAHPFQVDLRTPFRGVRQRSGVVFPGPVGWGEFSPFTDYSDQRSALWLQAAVEAACVPVSIPADATVAVNAIIGDSEDPGAATRRAIREYGATTIKVKVGHDLARDLATLDAVVAELIDPRSRIRIDANGRWTLEQARAALRAMSGYPIEYVEQPCADRESLRELHRDSPVPIAVDESIRIDHARDIHEIADLAILKVSPLGGLARTEHLAQQVGVPVRISGALETSVGLFPSLCAAWLLAPEHAAGVGTGALFATDLVDATTLPRQGVIPVVPRAPDPVQLEAARVHPMAHAYWRERTRASWDLLPESTRALIASGL